MNVLVLSRGYDTAGVGIGLKRAFESQGIPARAVRRWASPYGHPADVVWNRDTVGEIRRLFRDADVVHVLQTPAIVTGFEGYEQKHIVVAHLGTYFRDSPLRVSGSCRAIGADETVMSHELLAFAPNARLLPNAVDLDRLAAMGPQRRVSRSVRIAHAPTNRSTKGTAAFLRATERLSKRYRIVVDVIEGVSWQECIRRKARADILFDQAWTGYGLNAVEAWAMGIPVVAGLTDPAARRLFLDDWGEFPYVDTIEETLEAALEPLVAEPSLRRQWGEKGRAFAERYHSHAAVVARALAIYERQAVAA